MEGMVLWLLPDMMTLRSRFSMPSKLLSVTCAVHLAEDGVPESCCACPGQDWMLGLAV